MNFDYSEEQTLLQDTLARFLRDHYDFEQRQRLLEATNPSPEIWGSLAELGLMGVPFPEELGGLGGGAVDTMIVAEQLGRHLVVEPWIDTVVMAGGLLQRAGTSDQCAARLEKLVEGSLRIAFAQAERQSGHDLHDVATTAKKTADGWVLSGEKVMVPCAETADEFIVTARLSGDRRDREGLGLFLVPADAAGLTITGYDRIDGRRAGNLALGQVQLGTDASLGEGEGTFELIEACVDRTISAQLAEVLGSMQAALDMTVEYLKTRKQFGRPIGSFQALQHRASEMVVAVEQARSMAILAAMRADDPDRLVRRRAISAAKVEVCRYAGFVAEQAVQLHGGIGMTMEYAVGHHLKHVKGMEATFGNADSHIRALTDLGGPFGEVSQ